MSIPRPISTDLAIPSIICRSSISRRFMQNERRRRERGQGTRTSGPRIRFCYVTGHRRAAGTHQLPAAADHQFFMLFRWSEKMNWYDSATLAQPQGLRSRGSKEVFARGNARPKKLSTWVLDLHSRRRRGSGWKSDVSTPTFGPIWTAFRETVQAYYESVLQLGRTLFRAYFAIALGLEEERFRTLRESPAFPTAAHPLALTIPTLRTPWESARSHGL